MTEDRQLGGAELQPGLMCVFRVIDTANTSRATAVAAAARRSIVLKTEIGSAVISPSLTYGSLALCSPSRLAGGTTHPTLASLDGRRCAAVAGSPVVA